MSFSLEYVPDTEAALKKLRGLIKENGRAVSIIHHPESSIVKNFKKRIGFKKEYCREFLEWLRDSTQNSTYDAREAERRLAGIMSFDKISRRYSEALNAV